MLLKANQLINMNGHLAVLLVSSLVFSMGQLAASQFLQPQSHLGRLVQSITSPLILTPAVGSGAAETNPGESSSYDPETMAANYVDQPRIQHGQRGQQAYQPEEAGQHYQHYRRQPQAYAASVPLQQAPSRGIPQRYYDAQSSADGSADDDEGSQMGPSSTGGRYRQASRHHRQQQQPAAAVANEQYQMGAYLGPTIDDKEIQGAFNSNDDRDDDDTPGYDGPPRNGEGGLRQDAAANAYMTSSPLEGAGSYGGSNGRQRDAQPGGDFDDESNADDDDAGEAAPRQRQPRRFRQSGRMNQAASQYRDERKQQDGGPPQSASMMTAANGYSQMGSSPFDLSSLMAAAAGAGNGNGQAYEVYNGDGSYPGYYPQQQQQRQQGRRAQAASMQNPYGYNQMNGNQNRQRDGADVDDVDSEGDDD